MCQNYFANTGWFEFTGKCAASFLEDGPIWFPGYTVYQFPVNMTQLSGHGGTIGVYLKSSIDEFSIMTFEYDAQQQINSFGLCADSNALEEQFASKKDSIILNTGIYTNITNRDKSSTI